jgi:hypothetical protein
MHQIKLKFHAPVLAARVILLIQVSPWSIRHNAVAEPHPEDSAIPITVPMDTAAIGLHHKAHPTPADELTR